MQQIDENTHAKVGNPFPKNFSGRLLLLVQTKKDFRMRTTTHSNQDETK